MATTVKKFIDQEGLAYFVSKLYARGFKGMGLSQENFTTELLAKLNSTATTEGLDQINTRLAALEKLIDTDKDGAINKFNEIVAFLAGIEDTQTLAPVVADVATNKADITALKTTVGNKVDKVSGKGLSTNDYTAADKAEVAKIANKVDKVTGKGLSTNDYTTADKNLVAKISGKLDAADLVAITTAEIDAMIAAE